MKDKNSNSKSKSSGGKPNNKQGCIIRFKPPKPSEEVMKAKFFEADDTEVSELVRCYQTGDDHANLVALMSRIIGLGDLYGLWNDGKSQKLAQTMSRALDDQVREEWQAITSEMEDWDQADMKAIFISLMQQLATQVFGPTAFKTQCRLMENGDIKIPENDLRAGTYRIFQINRLLPYLGIYATEYSTIELNKIIVKSLPAMAKRKYLVDGGDDLEDQADILELMTQLDTKFRLKKEFAELEKQSLNNKQGKSNQSSNNGNNKGGNGNGNGKKSSNSNPCRKHDGAHEWKDCPDNKSNQNKSKGDKDAAKEKKSKGDLHSTKAAETPANKKTPVVRFNSKVETKEADADLQYDDSDDASAMMVQAVENKARKFNGVTVIDVPAKDGARLGTTILIDNGFSGYAIMTYPFASQLGYDFQRVEGDSYNTVGGTLNTKLQVTIDNIRLPHLSRHRTFSATIEVAPESSGDFGYGMIMGIEMMDHLGINQFF